jgi:hypothetical protein
MKESRERYARDVIYSRLADAVARMIIFLTA